MSRGALTPTPCAGWLAARDARLRVLLAVGFAFAATSLQRLPMLALALGLAIGVGLALRIPLAGVWKRLLAFEGFMLVVLLFMPFSMAGEPWFALGPLVATYDGLWRAVGIVLKANAVVICLLALVGTLEPVRFGHALAGLRVPDKLVHLFLFTVRYVAVLEQEYRRLRLAMRARAFVARSDRHTWRSLGWLVGMLMVRSMERSRRIVAAMKCRGFNRRFYVLQTDRWGATDSRALAAGLGLILLLPLLDRWP